MAAPGGARRPATPPRGSPGPGGGLGGAKEVDRGSRVSLGLSEVPRVHLPPRPCGGEKGPAPTPLPGGFDGQPLDGNVESQGGLRPRQKRLEKRVRFAPRGKPISSLRDDPPGRLVIACQRLHVPRHLRHERGRCLLPVLGGDLPAARGQLPRRLELAQVRPKVRQWVGHRHLDRPIIRGMVDDLITSADRLRNRRRSQREDDPEVVGRQRLVEVVAGPSCVLERSTQGCFIVRQPPLGVRGAGM